MEELENLKNNDLFSAEYRRKKIISWLIRTIIAIILFVIFWEHDWIEWALYIYIPINLLGFVMIFSILYFLKRKQEKLEKDLHEL